ncbi:MFS transporter [Schaalia vaccimaxillae]|uniref:MFS transporter n=1 Tax=Schaalia vaccimaxillae TaxID=183916 RepID=UPI0003B4D316|nr:MFS transporter [Schaalia vaccimaxillae]
MSTLLDSQAHSTRPQQGGPRLSLLQQIGYGLGDAGMNFSWTFISSFAMFYMTNYVGVGATILGTLMLVARLTDGVSDLVFGLLLDRTRTRWGQARPWLFWSTFPLAVGTFMLFNVPQGLSESARAGYFFVLYLLIGTFFYTAANISYNALVALSTTHEPTRVSMGSIRFIFTILAVLTISSVTLKLVDIFGKGSKGWAAVGGLYGLVIVVLLLISFFSLKELKTWTKEEAAAEKHKIKFEKTTRHPLSSRRIGTDIATVVRNPYFLMILGITTLFYINNGLTGGAGVYFATYILGNGNYLGPLTTAAFAPMVVVLAFLPTITQKYGVWRVNVISSAISAIGYGLGWFFQDSLPGLLGALVIAAIGNASFLGTFMAYVAAVGDNIQLRKGNELQGLTFSASSIGIKVGQGIGAAAVGWLLGAAGFDAALSYQSETVLQVTILAYLGISILLALLRLALFLPFRVFEANKKLREMGVQNS